MKKRNKIILSIISILLILAVGIGLSYAYWLSSHTQDTANTLSSKCFTISYTDQDNITLANQFPISDTEGLASTPYIFTITNTCKMDATFQINLETINTSTFSTSYVKASINLSGSTGTAKLLTSYSSATTTLDNASDSRKLKTGTLNSGQSKTYELRLWMDSTTPLISDSGKTYSSKIVVVSTASELAAPAEPELYQGMIPVTYDASGNVIVADTETEWYNYTDHNWANAVLVNCADTTIKDKYFNSDMSIKSSVVGTTMSMDEILQMYVWIPRYKYLLWNAENGSSDPQAITIVFEDKTTAKSSGTTNGTYLTHPAFTFGDTELNGIWVGKFENSGTTTGLTIKPNITSLTNITVGDMFNATRNQELTYSANYGIDNTSIDTHMIKNMEWGAVAYLSSSIYGRYNDSSACIASGCETWINNVDSGSYVGAVTGCSGSTVDAGRVSSTACASGYDWTTLGVNASTTGNIYGIYDMSGGSWEYVMGNMVDSSGAFYPSISGLTQPDTKYYDSYTYGTSDTDHARGKLGDATKETLKTFGSYSGGWNEDWSVFPNSAYSYSWFTRGGFYGDGSYAGVFHFTGDVGNAYSNGSFRSAVVSAQ